MQKTTIKEPCLLCGRRASELHHVKHRASGGPDETWNLIPICRLDHVRIHTEGLKKIASKSADLTAWLLKNGWALDSDGRKWRHY